MVNFVCDVCHEPVHPDGVRFRVEQPSTAPALSHCRYRGVPIDLCGACARVFHDALWPPRRPSAGRPPIDRAVTLDAPLAAPLAAPLTR